MAGNCNYQALKALFSWSYFRLYVRPEHVITVAYSLQLLFECTDFRGLIFRFGISVRPGKLDSL